MPNPEFTATLAPSHGTRLSENGFCYSLVKARMTSWFLLFLAFVFAGLAYDALNLAVPVKNVPFSVTAKGLGLPHEHVSLVEQERRKQWNNRYGLGDLSQIFWVWVILSFACALGVLFDFL